jgi:hypothetical protein
VKELELRWQPPLRNIPGVIVREDRSIGGALILFPFKATKGEA